MAEIPTRELAPGIVQIDCLLGGWDQMCAGVLIEAPRPALIETGPATSAETVKAALRQRGLSPGDLAYLAVSHIHLDHAGAVGDVLPEFPNATLLVHEKGARHMVDPTRLNASAGRVYGDLLDSLYGRSVPVAAERVRVPDEGEVFDLGRGFALEFFDAPGHAKHHLGILERSSGTLYCGDAVGVKLPEVGFLRPATPPADFDFELALATLRRFAEVGAARLVLAHFGEVEVATLDEAEHQLRRWVETAEKAYAEDPTIDHVADRLGEMVRADPLSHVPEAIRDKAEVLNGVHSNAAGLHLYLSRRESHHQ